MKQSSKKPEPEPMSVTELENVMLGVMKRADTSPEIVYAFKKTGRLLLNPEVYASVSQEERDEWDSAIMEYRLQKH